MEVEVEKSILERLKKELEGTGIDLPSLQSHSEEEGNGGLAQLREEVHGSYTEAPYEGDSPYGLREQEIQRIRQEIGFEETVDPFAVSPERPYIPPVEVEPEEVEEQGEEKDQLKFSPIPPLPKHNPAQIPEKHSLEDLVKEDLGNFNPNRIPKFLNEINEYPLIPGNLQDMIIFSDSIDPFIKEKIIKNNIYYINNIRNDKIITKIDKDYF